MRDVKKIVKEMSLEEKALMCSGANWFETKSVERLDVPKMQMFDGPNGLRKNSGESEKDCLGGYKAVQSTCFPTGSAMAASWDKELLYKIGAYMGEECQSEHVPLLLGPAINMKRSPLCGRNFEYLTEDPYLCGKLAAAIVNGIHSQGIGACLKHFAANNQEEKRLSVNNIIDERALREIYLAGFEIAVKESHPETIMCAYNQINGKHCSKNEHLLTEILRDDWGYDGFVMTDWGAMKDRVDSLKAGLELEMPYSGGENDRNIVKAVQDGELDEAVVDQAAERILNVVYKLMDAQKRGVAYDAKEHHQFAREAAADCMVLLKNEDSILPLNKDVKICLLGEFAEKTRYQGGGSSHVTTYAQDTILSELRKKTNNVSYAKGYELDGKDNEELLKEAADIASKSDVAIIIAGLPDSFETESLDRKNMEIPQNHIRLIQEVSKVTSNVIVVLLNGAPITIDWEPSVKGILEGYLGGQAAAGAICDLLMGDVNPSGKLAETFPIKLEDTSAYLNYGLGGYQVNYNEGIYIGYRYYDKKKMEVRYPFGYGLSYTSFEYSNLSISKPEILDTDSLVVSVDITNTGDRFGKEVVQIYVAPEDTTDRPVRELKGFEKVALNAGESRKVEFMLDRRSFAYFSTEKNDWFVKSGKYQIQAGSSSRDIRESTVVNIISSDRIERKIQEEITLDEIWKDERTHGLLREMLEKYAPDVLKDEKKAGIFDNMPLRQAYLFSRGNMPYAVLEQYIEKFNQAIQERG